MSAIEQPIYKFRLGTQANGATLTLTGVRDEESAIRGPACGEVEREISQAGF
jgi:hypothetical protein